MKLKMEETQLAIRVIKDCIAKKQPPGRCRCSATGLTLTQLITFCTSDDEMETPDRLKWKEGQCTALHGHAYALLRYLYDISFSRSPWPIMGYVTVCTCVCDAEAWSCNVT